MATATPVTFAGARISHCSARVQGLNHNSELLPSQLVGAWLSSRQPRAVSPWLWPRVFGTITSVIEPLLRCLKISRTPHGPADCRYSPLGRCQASRSPKSPLLALRGEEQGGSACGLDECADLVAADGFLFDQGGGELVQGLQVPGQQVPGAGLGAGQQGGDLAVDEPLGLLGVGARGGESRVGTGECPAVADRADRIAEAELADHLGGQGGRGGQVVGGAGGGLAADQEFR